MNSYLRKKLYKYKQNRYLRFIYYSFKNILKTIFDIWFWRDYFKYKKENNRFKIPVIELWPITYDKTEYTSFDSHYVYHIAWAIRKILEIRESENIEKHIDFSSSLHFCANLSAFLPVEFYDYRPARLRLSNLRSEHADLTNLENFKDNSIKSLSSMHVVEHIGLGRYGDKIDVEGDMRAINELKRVCSIGGNILFVVPVGKERIQFNAHRIYSFNIIKNLFGENFELKEFSLVDDNYNFLEKIDLGEAVELVENQSYGCGCFWFIKKYEK
ncbi:MAG: DUF268 domain-containing protein [Patescibacteria group bacterium]